MHKLRITPLNVLLLGLMGVLSNVSVAGEVLQKDTLVIYAKNDISMPLGTLPGHKFTNTISNRVQSIMYGAGLLTIKSFQGIGKSLPGYTVTTARPNLNGAAGIDQYLQWVDPDIAVFNKNTGTILPGFPKPGSAIWSGFGGPCETANVGEPKVKFDQLANRWVITRQAYSDVNAGPFVQCVAVSATQDATGSWYRYAFPMDSLNNFGTLGLWPDGYYLSVLMAGPTTNGPRICALERDKMLLGLPATAQCKQLTNAEAPVLRPVDLGSTLLPPAGSNAYFFGLKEPSELLFYKFHTDWTNPANTTLIAETLPTFPYAKPCPTTSGQNCAVQPGTTDKLSIVADRFTSRIVYYQYPGDIGSFVAIHNVRGDAPKFSPAIRWYEYRIHTDLPNPNPVIYQQETLGPDSKARFNGSVAIDRYHNIAVGYTVSSSAVHPSPELAYRNYYDPLNTLTVQAMYTGHGSEQDSIWSNYSQMSLDPVDKCTFWFSGEYLDSDGTYNWSTAITRFKLAGCA